MLEFDEWKDIEPKKKKYVTLRLEDDVADMVRKAANNAGITQSSVIRYLFKKYSECKDKQ